MKIVFASALWITLYLQFLLPHTNSQCTTFHNHIHLLAWIPEICNGYMSRPISLAYSSLHLNASSKKIVMEQIYIHLAFLKKACHNLLKKKSFFVQAVFLKRTDNLRMFLCKTGSINNFSADCLTLMTNNKILYIIKFYKYLSGKQTFKLLK